MDHDGKAWYNARMVFRIFGLCTQLDGTQSIGPAIDTQMDHSYLPSISSLFASLPQVCKGVWVDRPKPK